MNAGGRGFRTGSMPSGFWLGIREGLAGDCFDGFTAPVAEEGIVISKQTTPGGDGLDCLSPHHAEVPGDGDLHATWCVGYGRSKGWHRRLADLSEDPQSAGRNSEVLPVSEDASEL